MSITLEMAREASWCHRGTRCESSIGAAVRSMLGNQVCRVYPERRREQRYPFPYPIRITPVTTDGSVSPAESIVVLGKHLSEHGVDFYYSEPLPYRRVIASFEQAGREVLHLMMDLTWCRFGRHGWYENGGRFLQILPGAKSNSDNSQPDVMEDGLDAEPILDAASIALFSVRAGA